jgi:hypothetical protein
VLVGISALFGNPQNAAHERNRYVGLAQSLHSSLSIQPFGDRKAAMQAAKNLWCWADQILEKRGNLPIDQDRATAALTEACRIGETRGVDYDSARQLAWAAQVLYSDIIAANAGARPNPTIVSALKSLDNHLLLQLPSAKEHVQIESSLKTRLDFASKYVPSRVRTNFEQIFNETKAGRLKL